MNGSLLFSAEVDRGGDAVAYHSRARPIRPGSNGRGTMATSGSLGLADSLREQRVLELHKRLSSAANEFPALTHFGLRSDDPRCWKSLHLANCDGLNAQIPALPPARKGCPDTRIRQLKRWEQDFGRGLLSDSERGQFDAQLREWVWERSLTECCRDQSYHGGFIAVGQRLTINGRDWIGRLVDPTVREMASCKGFHLMRRLAPQLLPDLLGVEHVANLDWNEQERLWMERLYEFFPSESRHFGPIEILTLPMNVFATTARAIELTSDADDQRDGQPGYLGLIVNKDRHEVLREGIDRVVQITGPVAWPMFIALYSAAEDGLSTNEVRSLPGDCDAQSRRKAKQNLKTNLIPLSITIPDGEWKLSEA